MKKIDTAKRGSFVLASGSLKLLENQFNADESPIIVAQGSFDDKAGVVAATDQRVIYVSKVLFSSVVKDVPYSKLSSVLYESGLMWATVKLEFSGGKMEIKQIDKKAAKELVEAIKAQLDKKEEKPAPPAAQAPGDDLYSKLSRLAELKEKGVLTEDEFLSEKRKLLG